MNYKHQHLASGRWFELNLMEQMANIGAEIGRAINWRRQANPLYSQQAFFRGLELLWLTIEDPQNRGARLKELCRLKEVLADYFMGDNQYQSSDELWEKYFYPFNYAARRLQDI